MKTFIAKRFKCDYCRKVLGRLAAMEKHEARCFSNPNRVCPLCADDQLVQVPLSELLSILATIGQSALIVAASECPACITATLTQNMNHDYPRAHPAEHYDYREGLVEWQHNNRGIYHEDNYAY